MKQPVRKEVTILNATAHWVNVIQDSYVRKFSPNQVDPIRIDSVVMPLDTLGGIPLVSTTKIIPESLPPQIEGTYYIVSSLVGMMVNRADFICPHTTAESVIRDDSGKVIAVKEFQSFYVPETISVKNKQEVLGDVVR